MCNDYFINFESEIMTDDEHQEASQTHNWTLYSTIELS